MPTIILSAETAHTRPTIVSTTTLPSWVRARCVLPRGEGALTFIVTAKIISVYFQVSRTPKRGCIYIKGLMSGLSSNLTYFFPAARNDFQVSTPPGVAECHGNIWWCRQQSVWMPSPVLHFHIGLLDYYRSATTTATVTAIMFVELSINKYFFCLFLFVLRRFLAAFCYLCYYHHCYCCYCCWCYDYYYLY